MPQTITVGPLTRVEGHLDITADIAAVGGVQQVTRAASSGTMFRGFERILANRDPRDAPHYTQRICGVCPTAHGMASSLALEAAFGMKATNNGRILRNLVLGADFLQSHILHFYHLSALDYVDTTGLLELPPWTPRYNLPAGTMITGSDAANIVSNYVTALGIRRQAHQMGAIFGGKLPTTPRFVPGGCPEVVTAQKIADFRKLLSNIRGFIDGIYLADVAAIAQRFPEYGQMGRGCGNLLAFGVFDLNAAGTSKLLARGRYTDGGYGTVDLAKITEYVKYSRYAAATTGLNPANGQTEPQENKPGAYSWIKAPRYLNKPHEVGALARMWINGDYRRGPSVLDRMKARAQETQKIAAAMSDWLNQLVVGGPTQIPFTVPAGGNGIGLTEAPRGALGHWVQVANSLVARYQIVTPTAWNASPLDDLEQPGPIEQALLGTPVADPTQPIELLRVVHSFDPCLACSVHTVRGRSGAAVACP